MTTDDRSGEEKQEIEQIKDMMTAISGQLGVCLAVVFNPDHPAINKRGITIRGEWQKLGRMVADFMETYE